MQQNDSIQVLALSQHSAKNYLLHFELFINIYDTPCEPRFLSFQLLNINMLFH